MRIKDAIVAASFGVCALLAAPVHAGTITDTYDPYEVLFTKDSSVACTGANPTHTATGDTPSGASTCASLEFTHFITPEFSPGSQTLTSALLTLFFHDDVDESGQGSGAPESYTLALDGASPSGELLLNNNTTTTVPDINVQFQMAGDGQLLLKISRAGGGSSDFYFDKSVVVANWREGQDLVPAPEPASLMLLGTGLAGLVARSRRRKQA